MPEKPERPTKTVYMTPEMLDAWHRSGKTIGEIFRAGLAVSVPAGAPGELQDALAVLGEIATALSNGAVLSWPDGHPGTLAPVPCGTTVAHDAHDHDAGWCPGVTRQTPA